MLCGQSAPRSFRMMTLLITWLHLLASIILILGIATDDINVEVFASDGVVKFYVLCFSILFIMPQLLALYGVYQKSSLFLSPYIISLMTLVSLLVLILIIIIVGMIFDPEHLLNEWASPKVSYCQSMHDLWLTILGMMIVIVIASVCLFIVYSYYKILLKQEQLNQRSYVPNERRTAPAAVAPQQQSRLGSQPRPPTSQPPAQPSPNADEDPPPSYSRAQSVIGQSYV